MKGICNKTNKSLDKNVEKITLGKNKFALIDSEDYFFLKIFQWGISKSGRFSYASNKSQGYMHRLICFVGKGIDLTQNDEVDHINGNTLDNRKCNLRVVSHRQNCQNKHVQKTSKYPGVSWDRKRKLWVSHIHIKGENKNLGYSNTELKAFNKYKKAVHGLGEKVVCELKTVEVK